MLVACVGCWFNLFWSSLGIWIRRLFKRLFPSPAVEPGDDHHQLHCLGHQDHQDHNDRQYHDDYQHHDYHQDDKLHQDDNDHQDDNQPLSDGLEVDLESSFGHFLKLFVILPLLALFWGWSNQKIKSIKWKECYMLRWSSLTACKYINDDNDNDEDDGDDSDINDDDDDGHFCLLASNWQAESQMFEQPFNWKFSCYLIQVCQIGQRLKNLSLISICCYLFLIG